MVAWPGLVTFFTGKGCLLITLFLNANYKYHPPLLKFQKLSRCFISLAAEIDALAAFSKIISEISIKWGR